MDASTIKANIKKELIDHYDSITNKLDIRAQQLLISLEKEDERYDEVKRINQKYESLLKKIETFLNTNLNEINNYFDSSLKNDDELRINDNQFLKQTILSCYLTYIELDNLEEKYKNIHELGVMIDSDWVLTANELNYIRYDLILCI